MKTIRYLIVAAALGCGFVSCAQAHVSIGIGFSAPVYPVMPAVPVIAAAPVYVAPPPVSPPVPALAIRPRGAALRSGRDDSPAPAEAPALPAAPSCMVPTGLPAVRSIPP